MKFAALIVIGIFFSSHKFLVFQIDFLHIFVLPKIIDLSFLVYKTSCESSAITHSTIAYISNTQYFVVD